MNAQETQTKEPDNNNNSTSKSNHEYMGSHGQG